MSKKIAFICVENSNRSQMAEAFARLYADNGTEASSAGLRPSGRVHPKAIEAMHELGYDLTVHRSKGLVELPDVEFDVVVTLGCEECPQLRAKAREDWIVPCPKELPPEPFRRVRDQIEREVKKLLVRLDAEVNEP